MTTHVTTHRTAGMLCALFVIVPLFLTQTWSVCGAENGSEGGVPRPTVTAIPRPTLVPSTEQQKESSRSGEAKVGSHVVLKVATNDAVSPSWWTVIQWQDNRGRFHDVEGWRSQLSAQRRQRWWVASKDAETGLFRWQIYDSNTNYVIWTSQTFYLPADGQELTIEADITRSVIP